MIITFTGPSGVGKSTIRRMLKVQWPEVFAIVPMITQREPKVGDEGEYVYVSREEFDDRKVSGHFVASTRIPGAEERWYGYERIDTESAATPLLITDHAMLLQLKEQYGDALYSIGLLPPGNSNDEMLQMLHERLRTRGRETEEQIAERLVNAKEDIRLLQEENDLWDFVCVNDVLDDAVHSIKISIDRVHPFSQ